MEFAWVEKPIQLFQFQEDLSLTAVMWAFQLSSDQGNSEVAVGWDVVNGISVEEKT